MLDPKGNEIRGSQLQAAWTDFSQSNTVFITADPKLPDHTQAFPKKNTVKELLMMRRQKWNCSRDDVNLEQRLKIPKSEAFANNINLHQLGPPAPVYSMITNHFVPAAPEYNPNPLQQIQHPPLQGQMAPAADVRMSLFHWQILQEVKRVGGVSPEQLNMQDSDGDTYLHIAVAQGKRALAFVLAAKMASCGSLDMKEHNGQTALQIAAATNHPFIVQDLLQHGADVDHRDLWGCSPLHVCAEKGHFLSLQSIWRTLMGSGRTIDIEMYNYEGHTALHTAVLSHSAVVREQRRQGNCCSFTVMEQGQKRQSYIECLKTLLLMGASCGTKDLKSGRTCLHMAAEEADVELFHIFFEESSTLQIVNAKTFSGNTALHIVSSLQNHNRQVEMVKLLMRKGADPGIRNFENDLPSQLVPEGPIGEKVEYGYVMFSPEFEPYRYEAQDVYVL
ncbi:NF-kappa-B inhibitor zeta isoform X1 [Labrus mixtus]|uniref:NF-kappa-B inhibitor zeta isoform X1 n=1 Tax=Labrus mixtus TaxID=508554 RepID=UPI0029C0C3D4|nr:NF-kappa-B inhibitor zeta isoform X1 [Labrus mixtus]XP_060888311.1 NF-kappa-B inhibitor zeta isoform X1 [Labrus mixtus]